MFSTGTTLVSASAANLLAMITSVGRMNSMPFFLAASSRDLASSILSSCALHSSGQTLPHGLKNDVY